MNFRKLFHYGAWAMIVTGLIHLMGHFTPSDLSSPEKQELMDLMTGVKFSFDPWFSRSTKDLFDAFSLFLTVMLLTLGIVNIVIYRSNVSDKLIGNLSLVNFIGMAGMLALSFVYAFSVPISLFSICAVLMLVAWVRAL